MCLDRLLVRTGGVTRTREGSRFKVGTLLAHSFFAECQHQGKSDDDPDTLKIAKTIPKRATRPETGNGGKKEQMHTPLYKKDRRNRNESCLIMNVQDMSRGLKFLTVVVSDNGIGDW